MYDLDADVWRCFDGARWQQGPQLLRAGLMDLVRPGGTLLQWHEQLTAQQGTDAGRRGLELMRTVLRWTGTDAGHRGLEHLLQVVCGRRGLRFDEDPELLGFENGVYDFRAQLFRPLRASDKVSLSCGFAFEPLMPGIRWEDAEGDQHVVSYGPSDPAFGEDSLDPNLG